MSVRIAAFSSVDLSLPQGHALHVRGLLDALALRGNEVVLVTPRPARRCPRDRFQRIEVPFLRWRVLGPWSFELLGGLCFLYLCLRRRPHVIHIRQDLYTVAAALVGRILNIPVSVEVNSSIPEELALWGRPAARRLALACESFTLRRAAAVLVLGEALGRQILGRTGIDAGRLRLVPVGTHLPERTDPQRVRSEQGVPPGTFLLGFAGNLWPVQGVEVLLNAAARLASPDLQLWIIGSGVQEDALRRRAAEAGLAGAVRFFGGLPREQADRLLAACQVLVAPYLCEEYDRIAGGPISTKVMAYLASDRPILISDIPYYDWIQGIGAGGSFRSGDPASLADQIERWRARWRTQGSPLQDWPWPSPGPGRRFVESGHTWDQVAACVEGILTELSPSAGNRTSRPGEG